MDGERGHWLSVFVNKSKDKGQALHACKRRSGRCRAIGVSNYQQRHLEELLAAADVKPMVNQARCPRCCTFHTWALPA